MWEFIQSVGGPLATLPPQEGWCPLLERAWPLREVPHGGLGGIGG